MAAILVSAVLYALNLVVARVQSQAARPGEIAFFQSAIVTTILLLAAPWLLAVPPAAEWWKIAVAAMLATGSLFLLAWAYAHGETGYLGDDRIYVVRLCRRAERPVFGERVATTTLLGTGVIVAACLFAARRRRPGVVEVGA
ncbi:hypothetical protein AB5I41_22510 [Sphingomonas sp. MMS24-JH45]